MSQFTLSTVGTLDFPSGTDGYWEFSFQFSGRAVEFDINVDDGEMTESLFDKIKPFIADASRFDTIAKNAIRDDYAKDSESSSCLYLNHHAEEFGDEEREKYFGSTDVANLGAEQLIGAIHLKRIGLYPESDDYVAVFDYTFGEDVTDYVLAVEFEGSGEVFGISMDG